MFTARNIMVMLFIVFLFFPFHGHSASEESKYKPLLEGMVLYRNGKYTEALGPLRVALEKFPDHADVLFYIGMTYLQLKEYDRAVEYLGKSVEKDPAYVEARYYLGIAFIQKESYKNAIKHLEFVYGKTPQRKDLGYFLGFCYYQLGKYKKALSYFDNARTDDKSIRNLTTYYSGLAKQNLGQNKAAMSDYDQLIVSDPTSPLSEPSKRLIEYLKTGKELEKRFSFDIVTKLQYDDNPILVPTTDVFNLKSEGKESMVELVYLRAAYSLLKGRDYDLSLSYGLYQAFYSSIAHMDVQDHIASLDFTKRGGIANIPYEFRLTYSYDYLLQDYDYYLQRHTVRPAMFFLFSKANLGLVQYTFQLKQFNESPEFEEENRDGHNNEIGYVHFLRFSDGKHYIKAGYFYDDEYTKGDDYDYEGNKYVVGCQYTGPWNLRFNADYEYKEFRYKNTNIFFDEKRTDYEKTLFVALSKDIIKNMTVSLEWMHRDNDSTLEIYNYRKNLYSAGLSWKY